VLVNAPELPRESGPPPELLHSPVDCPNNHAANEPIKNHDGSLENAAAPISSTADVTEKNSRGGNGHPHGKHSNSNPPWPSQVLPTASDEYHTRSYDHESENHPEHEKPPPRAEISVTRAATDQLGRACLYMRRRRDHAHTLRDHAADGNRDCEALGCPSARECHSNKGFVTFNAVGCGGRSHLAE